MLIESDYVNNDMKVPKKPESKPEKTEEEGGEGSEVWFILKGDDQSGPYSFNDLIKMLQDKTLFEFDYIWRAGQDSWKRVAEVAEFTPDGIKSLKQSKMSAISNIFFRRRFKR